jgi:hypothetical protein
MLLTINTGVGLSILGLLGLALVAYWAFSVPKNMSKQEQWLYRNNVNYYRSSKGSISVNYNDIPKHLTEDYNALMYNIKEDKL